MWASLVALALAGPPPPTVAYLSAAPTTLDPLLPSTPVDRLVHSLLHDRLFHPAGRGEPWSRLVAEWSVDATEARVTLGKGITWHDGHPVDAGDLCFTLEALLQPRTASPSGPRVRAGVSACRVDPSEPRTAVITLWSPLGAPQVAQLLAVPLAPQHAYDSATVTGDPRVQQHAIGVGPYRLAARHPDGTLELRAHAAQLPVDTLWLAPGASPGINALSVADGAAAATAWVPPPALPRLREATEVGLYPWDRLVSWSLALDAAAPALADPAVRHGLDLLLDREALRNALSGGADPTRSEHPWPLVSGPFRAGSAHHSRGIQPPLRDPEAAAEWLLRGGWSLAPDATTWLGPDGEPVQLRVAVPAQHGFDPAAVGPALGWRGIEVELVVVGPSAWRASVHAGGHKGHSDAILLPRDLYPTDDPSPWFAARGERAGWSNVFDLSDDTTDALLAAYRADPSEASGRALHAHLVDTRWHLFLFEERAWTAWQGPWSAWVPAPYDGWSRIDRWRR